MSALADQAPPSRDGHRLRSVAAVAVIVTLLAAPFGLLFLGPLGTSALGALTPVPRSDRLLFPTSSVGHEIDVDYPFRLITRTCGQPIDFDGSFWAAEPDAERQLRSRMSGSGKPIDGVIRRTDAGRAVFRVDESTLALSWVAPPIYVPICASLF